MIAIREGDLKYIYGPQPELYDLKNDPYEENDLIASKPDEAARMNELLQRHYGDDLASTAKERPTEQLSAGDIEMLRTLGYTVSGVSSAPDLRVLPNPRDMLGLVTKVEIAIMRGDMAATPPHDGYRDLAVAMDADLNKQVRDAPDNPAGDQK